MKLSYNSFPYEFKLRSFMQKASPLCENRAFRKYITRSKKSTFTPLFLYNTFNTYQMFNIIICFPESKQCKVLCVHYKGGLATSFGALPDGAPCSYDRPFDVCFQVNQIQNNTDSNQYRPRP